MSGLAGDSNAGRPDQNKLLLKYPASWWQGMWREALPSGNGRLGASVQGGVQEEIVLLQHADLWHWGQKHELPDVSHTLPETRRLMDEERYLEASWHLTRTLQSLGYASRLSSRFPLVALTVTMPGNRAFRSYRRELEMDTGEVQVRWQDGEREYSRCLFVSRADDCIVYKVEGRELERTNPIKGTEYRAEASSEGSLEDWIEGMIGLRFHPGDKVREDDEFKALASSITVRVEDNTIYYGGRNDDGQDFGAVLVLNPLDGGHTVRKNSTDVGSTAQKGSDKQAEGSGKAGQNEGSGQALAGHLHFRMPGTWLILVKVFATGERQRQWSRLKEELSQLASDYDVLLSRHVALHQPLFRSVGLDLDDEGDDGRCNEEMLLAAYEGTAPAGLVRKLWAFGRYLFISGTHEHGQTPFGLYGLWGGDYRLIWGHHMANENVQMMHWHSNVGGLSCLNRALFRYYNGLMEDFRDNARKLYGCRGIYIPAGTTPGIGVPNQIVPVIMNWTGAAGWLARHYYEHYRYTGDLHFLRDEALPFMREALLFYEDFLVPGPDGKYIIYPSVSPENTPQNFMPKDGQQLAHPMPTAMNATMDVAIVKELLQHTIQASHLLGIHKEDIPRWEAMLGRLPAYMVNPAGAVKEWLHPAFEDRQDHRHLSHMYPVFPGQEVTREQQPELFKAFETAVHQRRLGAQSGWSLAHMSSVYARLGDGDRALECLDVLARSCVLHNGFTLHNDWRQMGVSMTMPAAPVQLDANLGWVNAVQEMLLYVSPQWIKLLPALPSSWVKGSFRDWRIPEGSLSLHWDRSAGAFRAEISALRPMVAKLQLPPWVPGIHAYGQKDGISGPTAPGEYKLQLETGERLMIEQA